MQLAFTTVSNKLFKYIREQAGECKVLPIVVKFKQNSKMSICWLVLKSPQKHNLKGKYSMDSCNLSAMSFIYIVQKTSRFKKKKYQLSNSFCCT